MNAKPEARSGVGAAAAPAGEPAPGFLRQRGVARVQLAPPAGMACGGAVLAARFAQMFGAAVAADLLNNPSAQPHGPASAGAKVVPIARGKRAPRR